MRQTTKLKMELLRQNKTQEWLSQVTGIPSNSISRIANGTRPSLDNALIIASALGVKVEELWTPSR